MAPVACADPANCTVPVPAGLDDVPMAIDPAIGNQTTSAQPPGPYVYVADGAVLTYEGTAADGLGTTMSVPDLIAAGAPFVGGDVRLVDGWLIAGGILTDDKDENIVGPRPVSRYPRLGGQPGALEGQQTDPRPIPRPPVSAGGNTWASMPAIQAARVRGWPSGLAGRRPGP